MPHARQQIREAVVATLTGLPTTGARVYNTRVYPSGDQHMPGISVSTPRDSADDDSDRRTLGYRVVRILELRLEARVKPGEGTEPQDVLDEICLEVEQALMADSTLGNKLLHLELVDTNTEFSDELERPIGLAVQEWRAKYTVSAQDPGVLIYE